MERTALLWNGVSRFQEADVLSTLDQLNDAGSLEDPFHERRAAIAAQYGLPCPPILCSPVLSTSPASPLLSPVASRSAPVRRRSLLQRKRARDSSLDVPARPEPVRTLSAPLVGLARRVSLLSKSTSRSSESENEPPLATSIKDRRRSFDVECLLTARRSSLHHSVGGNSTSSSRPDKRRPLSVLTENEARRQEPPAWLDFPKRDVASPPARGGLTRIIKSAELTEEPEERSRPSSAAVSLARPLETGDWAYDTSLESLDFSRTQLTPELVRSRVDNLSLSSRTSSENPPTPQLLPVLRTLDNNVAGKIMRDGTVLGRQGLSC